MKHCISVVGLLVLGCNSDCEAQVQAQESQPLITDRPDFTESPQTVPTGRVQIEAGVTYERAGNARQTTVGETLIRVAAGKRAEVRIGVPSYLVARDGGRATGWDDLFLGAKFALSAHEKHPVALLLVTTLPTGSRRVAPRTVQPEAVLATEFDLTEKVGLAINVGAGRPNEGSGAFNQYFGSASLGFDLCERVGAYAEVYAFNRTERGGSSQKYINGGFTYALKPDVQLDARVGFGLNNDVGGPDYFYGVGLARRF
ncbi:hypothetical protein IAD21_05057 [Abditibacteriota bacterium]|nr:hypothetical protein IAD21_05057 [Abditibacteriota bacterium]